MKSLALAVVALLVLVVLNPPETAHRELIRSEIAALIQREHPIGSAVASGLGRLVGVDVVGSAVDGAVADRITCSTYVVARVCSLDDTPLTFGALTRVWTVGELSLQNRER